MNKSIQLHSNWEPIEYLIALNIWFENHKKISDKKIILKVLKQLNHLSVYCSSYKELIPKDLSLVSKLIYDIENISKNNKIDVSSKLKHLFKICENDQSSLNNFMKMLRKEISLNICDTSTKVDNFFYEGNKEVSLHLHTERNPNLVKAKKRQFIANNKSLFCEACNFNFEDYYGSHGANYAQAHHLKPLSELKEKTLINLRDLVLLCSNCHSMIHRYRPWLTIEQLKQIIHSSRNSKSA
jgi:predicted HNH restriction endonuclease